MSVISMKRLKYLRYFFRYLFDREVPVFKKIWIYLVIIYFLSPIDFLPDRFPGLGWIDDLLILLWSVPKLLRTLEEYANSRTGQTANPNGPTIDDVEYHVHDEHIHHDNE
jgi:uncharacterized membrane protein YkvA (DUF1232 family)